MCKNHFSALSLLLAGTMLLTIAACTDHTSSDNNPPTEGNEQVEGNGQVENNEQEHTPFVFTTFEDEDMYYWRPQITEKMPVIRINTDNGSNSFATDYNLDSKNQIKYEKGTVTVENSDGMIELDNFVTEVKARGNYTLNYAKKPLRLKLDKKKNLLGLHDGGEYKNWVLLADVKDLSMSNNATAFYLGKTILGSNGYYSSDYRNVEVYLNGQYWGVYLLVEQQEVKNGKSGQRMSVPEVEDDYTGTDIGYLVEYDTYYTSEGPDGDPTFTIGYDGNTQYTQYGYTIKSDIYDNAQQAFIQRYLSNVYRVANQAVKGNFYQFDEERTKLTKLTDKTGYTMMEIVDDVIDIQSLVDTYILSEICCDPDIDWSSFYISVDMSENGNKKLVFEAPWDFDSAFGIRPSGPTGVNSSSPTGMYVQQAKNPWLNLFLNQSWFKDLVKEKWAKLVEAGVPETALELINNQRDTYAAYYSKNNDRWPNLRNDSAWGELNGAAQALQTQADAANYLYNWLEQRFAYLDKQWRR